MKTRKLVIMALFIAVSFLGANIKIMGTIAFDSMAGFLGCLILGPVYGAVIGALGHFLTAATSGFPYTLPVHMLIMVDMALTMFFFGIIYNKLSKVNKYLGIIAAVIIGIIINGPISVLMIVPIMGWGMISMIPILCLAAFLNILIAYLIYKFLPENIKAWK
ncbi:MAG: ECF transporter S component [Clostridium sp.]|uniref:ECF transporter S component n=1 Tax=Clostridium sp. TaxID=1506 RepID=UPI0039ECB886